MIVHMSRKVYITAKVNLILSVDEGANVEDIVSEIEGTLPPNGPADLVGFEISEPVVTDSK